MISGHKAGPEGFDYNADRIDALAQERQIEWSRIGAASFLTQDERREAVGYGSLPTPASGPTELRYAPNQPRVPAGSPQGGQWTSGGGGGGLTGSVGFLDDAAGVAGSIGADATQTALNFDPNLANDSGIAGFLQRIAEKFVIDLTEEQAQGGHPYSRHVGRTYEELIRRADRNRLEIGPSEFWEDRVGSFRNLFEANAFVNEALAQFWPTVEAVARGKRKKATLQAWFNRPTGYESYRRRYRDKVIIRQTTGVFVVIIHDPTLKKGFFVLTAYPNNPSEPRGF